MKIHDETKVPELLKMFEELSGSGIEIGVLGEGKGGAEHKDSEVTVVDIANFHEFGTSRAPERSFIRASFDINKSDYMNRTEKLLGSVMSLETSPDIMYETLGQYIVGQTQEYLTNLSSPPNSPITIMLKGSSNPLIDKGQLRSSIEWKKVK